ncbi:MAG TPA: hypothetical protein ENJ82_14860, partial [Bacteroidetes bacterium]|nr:hypothetical protein [Bacteroidota bacterium]
PFYREHWGFDTLDEVLDVIHGGNFSKLPIMRKSHLRSNFDDILDFEHATDLVSSSGTTGRPVDMPVHIEQEAGRVLRVRRLLRELGVRPGTKVLQLLSLNDMFTLGVLAWQAIKAEGATAIRCNPARLDRVLDAIKYNQPEFVIGNPYVMARMAEEAGDKWPKPSALPSGAFFAVAATFTSDLGKTPVAKEAIDAWGLTNWLNQYGTSELGPVGYEENNHQGLRIHNDFHYIELIDPATGLPVESGQPGEVVVTGLTAPRGFLPVRYGTGDVAAWLRKAPAQAGEKMLLGPIVGRTDHQLKVYGQTVFPNMLLNLADQVQGIQRSIVTSTPDPIKGDEVKILCVAKNGCDKDDVRRAVVRLCHRNLAVSPEVKMVDLSFLKALELEKVGKTNGSKVPRFFRL